MAMIELAQSKLDEACGDIDRDSKINVEFVELCKMMRTTDDIEGQQFIFETSIFKLNTYISPNLPVNYNKTIIKTMINMSEYMLDFICKDYCEIFIFNKYLEDIINYYSNYDMKH